MLLIKNACISEHSDIDEVAILEHSGKKIVTLIKTQSTMYILLGIR